jgi:hypothetical protein
LLKALDVCSAYVKQLVGAGFNLQTRAKARDYILEFRINVALAGCGKMSCAVTNAL